MSLEEQQAGERIESIQEMVSSVPGWLELNEGATLYELARFLAPVPTIVELGSWKGKSTCVLASAIKDRGEGKVHAVDLWNWKPGKRQTHTDEVFDEFKLNLEKHGLTEYVETIRMRTVDASRKWRISNPIGLLFIDASHRYAAVRADFEYWSPMVAVGGYIAFHDVDTWPGPTRLVAELPKWFVKVETEGLWVCRKVMEGT
ncbi:class I SAM-dependent methyltransferase [Paenibacillus mesophilus]|uniref:class I SAM-dependent methyltransferase n=1 Tax=Paenibacillus mesophilus TaxID=2582849 RepID=UPI00110D9388|nr:class I SAM-dependent methyltransferase [Paenibacillus mesophilus]TMV53014.1 class I SAM-dependent methyltransferase [Paenibacillus mesophilus]